MADYKHFDVFYDMAAYWATCNLDRLLDMRFGRKANAEAYKNEVLNAFRSSGLEAGLSTEKVHDLYHSDAKIAENRFFAGAYDTLLRAATQRGLIQPNRVYTSRSRFS
jgi:hypothetical protein